MFELALREFGHQGYTLADLPDSIPEGLTDQSWHNDVCPSIGAVYGDHIRVAAWIECEDTTKREFPEMARYAVTLEHQKNKQGGFRYETVLETESWSEVLAWFDVSDFGDAIARPITNHAGLFRFIRALIKHNAMFHFEDSPESIFWQESRCPVRPEHFAALSARVAEAYALGEWGSDVCPIGWAIDMMEGN